MIGDRILFSYLTPTHTAISEPPPTETAVAEPTAVPTESENNQQMGDGGFIMQPTNLSTGNVVAVSNAEWACTVIHEAPLNKSCENEANPVAGVAP